MADPLYSRSQMSTVAVAPQRERDNSKRDFGCQMSNQSWPRRGGESGTTHARATRVTTTTKRRRRAGKLKGPRRSSICEGCNGVLTGLAAALRTFGGAALCRSAGRGEESKSGGYLLSQQEDGEEDPQSFARLFAHTACVPLSSLFQVPIYFSILASLLLRLVSRSHPPPSPVAVSHPSVHPPIHHSPLPILRALIGLAFPASLLPSPLAVVSRTLDRSHHLFLY